MATLARTIFTGAGSIIPLMLMLGVGGWVGEYILSAIGKGREAQMLRMIVTFTGLAMVIKTVLEVLNQAAKVMGF